MMLHPAHAATDACLRVVPLQASNKDMFNSAQVHAEVATAEACDLPFTDEPEPWLPNQQD